MCRMREGYDAIGKAEMAGMETRVVWDAFSPPFLVANLSENPVVSFYS